MPERIKDEQRRDVWDGRMHYHRWLPIEKTIAHTVVEFQGNSKAAERGGCAITIKEEIDEPHVTCFVTFRGNDDCTKLSNA